MKATILHPEALNIPDTHRKTVYYGGDQEWYREEWPRKAGCGPTSAANITAYLAMTRPAMRPLYSREDTHIENFAEHMEEVFHYITPGHMGLNRLEMYTDGMEQFVGSRGVALQPHVFETVGNMCCERHSVEALGYFLMDGLACDCPIAFLNLTRGRVKNLQGWHWITITGVDMSDGHLYAMASDEGKEITIDLRLWYMTTRMRGGFIYFTNSKPA